MRIRLIAEAGRLRVSEERAAHLVHAVGCGTTLTLIAMPEDRRDRPPRRLATTSALTAHEQAWLQEWLDRIARS